MVWGAPLDGSLDIGMATETNSGTLPCDSVITITMVSSSTGLTLTLIESSEYLEVGTTVAAADEIVINTQQRSFTINGTDSSKYIDYDSTWFKLPVGDFTLQLDNATASLEIIYRERWM